MHHPQRSSTPTSIINQELTFPQANLEEALLSNPAWAGLRAVKEGNFHILERRMFSLKPNALWGDAYEQLADILCGE